MSRRARPSVAAVVAVAAVAAVAPPRTARAESTDPPRFRAGLAPPRLPAPFVLPELSHPRFDAGVDWFVGGLSRAGADGSAVATVVRASVETSIVVPRRIFVGATYPVAWGLPPDGGLAPGEVGARSGVRSLPGNLETHARVVFPLPTWLEAGLTLGITLPTSTLDRDDRASRSVAAAAATLDPTSYAHFFPDLVGLRPAGDLRILRGRFVFQGRHGVDILIDDTAIDRAKVAGRFLGHVGFLVGSDVELSIEASQVYRFWSDEKATGQPTPEKVFAERYRVSDDRRAAFTVGPALRLSSPAADVGIAVVTNVNDPFSPASSGFFGVRLSVIAHAAGGAP